MKIGVLGTGSVGRALAARLVEMGHAVVMGTRDPAQTMANNEPDRMGNPPFRVWHAQNSQVRLSHFTEAAAFGELLINALNGMASVATLQAIGAQHLDGKVLIDVANTLDFSHGMPPSLFVCNTDSLAEQIQRAFPGVKVVKSFSTMTAGIMVHPELVGGGDTNIFVSGNDAQAKERVIALLRSIGWKEIIDLGDITTARGVEMMLPMWLALMGVMKSPMFNIKIVQ